MMELGTRKMVAGYTCKAALPMEMANLLARCLVKFIGMRPGRQPRIDEYPFRGFGSSGYTFYFPLTDSYLIFDVYDTIKETKVLLTSCKPFDPDKVRDFLGKHLGEVREQGGFIL